MAIIEVDGLVKHYGSTKAVDGVSFTVEQGEIFALLGPNGAGKTTTVESIEGIRRPDRGRISVMGLDPQGDRDELRHVLGAQLQESQLQDKLRVGEALDLYRSFYRDPADPEELIEQLGLTEQRDTAYDKLSGGQKQRLSIALALIGNPRVAVLDELTTGLDPKARRATWDLIEQIRDRGVTILLVTHFMQEAERLSDRLAILDQGRVVALDTPAGIVSRVGAEQRIRFRPSTPIDDGVLTALPHVTGVSRHGGQIVVTGTADALHEVTATLARANIVAHDLRIDQVSLDDAFITLTGRPLEQGTSADSGA